MKKFLTLILSITLSITLAPSAIAATTLSNTASATNPIYVEDGAEVLIGEGITFTGSSSFTGGYIEFAVGSPAATDILNLQKVSTAIITSGVVSVVGGTIYKGDGTNANPVASIDGTLDGTAGKNLRIRFSSAFTNAGFETGNFTGWDYIGTRIDIGVTTLAGVVSSDIDNFYPNSCGGQSLNDNDAPVSANYYYEFSTAQKTEGAKSLRLYNTMTTANGGDIVHGPAVVSSEFTAANGDIISFDWSAQNGGDDFDVYGYLINSATGAQIEVIDANGSSQAWVTKSTTIPSTGNYRFVFINGTHDLSCGQAAGGSLYIDNIKVTGTSATEDLAQSIARLVTYKSTSNNPAASRTVTLSATPASGSITPISITVDVTPVDDGPVPGNISISYTDTSAADDFPASTGTISANDPDGGAGGGSTTYGIIGGTSAAGSTSKIGTYGTLTVNESTGAYSYEPDDSAINRVVINSTETFTISATSGALTGNATLTVSITGAAESAITAPVISNISPARGTNTGGTTVTITGTGFTTAQFVKFGSTFGTNLVIVSDTSLTITSPANLAGTYNVTVINNGGTNSGTNNFVYFIPSAPSAPTSLTGVAGNAAVTITWTAAADATSYVVTSNPGGFTCTTSGTSCTVSGLTNGTAYTFTAIARNAAGNSGNSSPSGSITPIASGPSAPTNVLGTAGNASAIITWDASAGATSYVVTSSPGSFTCNASGLTCTVSGLTNGTSYTFTVIASNADGDSSASNASAAVIPVAPAPQIAPPSQAAVNQQLANRIVITTPPSSNTGAPTGAITLNGISNDAKIFVAPKVIPTLPGFSNIRVLNNTIEVIPKTTFSGKLTVPVTVTENGAEITINVSIVVSPKPVTTAQVAALSSSKSGILWEPSENAVSYRVELNGKTACTSESNACNIPKLLGPNANLKVISLGNDGTISTQVIPAYTPSKLIPVLDVRFSSGSATLTRKEITKLNSFVKMMGLQGFTKVSIDAFTDGVGPAYLAQGLATSRAKVVANFLDRFLDVDLSSSGKGIAPTLKGSKKADPGSRNAQVSVL